MQKLIMIPLVHEILLITTNPEILLAKRTCLTSLQWQAYNSLVLRGLDSKCWIPNPGVSSSKPLDGSKVD